MQLTLATEYAVRCVLHLAGATAGTVVARREIAQARAIPAPFLAKLAQRLAHAGLIRIQAGARGGYALCRPASRITLLAVVEAADGELVLQPCAAKPQVCPNSPACAAHHVWAKARRQLRATLANVTFAQLAAQEKPPTRTRKSSWTC